MFWQSLRRSKIFVGKSYDFIFPFGDNCAIAAYMRECGLREMSGPFDWNGTTPRGLPLNVHFLETEFNDFLIRENLEQRTNPRGVGDDLNHDYYYDRETEYAFLHDFRRGVPFDEEFENVRKKYERRIGRALARIRGGGRTLLIFSGKFSSPNVATAQDAVRRVRAALGKNDIDLLVLLNDPDARDLRIEQSSEDVVFITGEFFSSRFPDWRGNIPLFYEVFYLFSYRHRLRESYRNWYRKFRARFVAAFIFDRAKRKAFRKKIMYGM